MENWDPQENQGRRQDQVEMTNRIVFFSLCLMVVSGIANLIYLWLN
jgi:uncharacterized membrane protein YidH (DUF202 family)